MKKEAWKKIKEASVNGNVFEISSLGNIRDKDKNPVSPIIQRGLLTFGYWPKEAKPAPCYVNIHVLVASYFLKNDTNRKRKINFIDGNKLNVAVSNLCYKEKKTIPEPKFRKYKNNPIKEFIKDIPVFEADKADTISF